MKKIIFGIYLLLVGVSVGWTAEATANTSADTQAVKRPLALAVRPSKEQRKIFKQRNKQIQRLVKQYQKATAEQKPLIKQELAQIISTATDEGLAWSKQRIAAEKENLIQWEQKLQEQEKNLDTIKEKRVEEILSGEAKHRYKLAKKRWKKEIKALQKSMK